MYAAAMGNSITVVFQCLSAISVNGFLTLSLRWFLFVAFLYLLQMFWHALLFGRSVLFFAFEKPLCIGKLLFQLRQNFILQVFDFYRLILYFYHQVSHMAELCHINIKRRLGRHIFFSDKVLQKIFCFCHNTTEQNSTETTFSSYLETFKSGAFRLVRS